MRLDTLDILRCPSCRGRLEVASRRAVTSSGRIREGLLGCSECHATYPVLGWVPRMMSEGSLTEVERSLANELRGVTASRKPTSPSSAEVVDEESITQQDYRDRIESAVRSKLLYTEFSPKMREREERDIEYRIEHTDRKDKFVKTAQSYLMSSPRSVLDVGGGQGGALTAFRQEFSAERSVLLDIDDEWVELAWLRDPETEVIRGDATQMPFHEGAFDFLFTQATLEHIPDWKRGVAEMCRVAGEGLLCYNPNGRFFYDVHVAAPFVTWLPKGPAAHVAHAYHKLRRTGRTMESIRGELQVTHYRPRAHVVRELRRLGCEVENAFGEFIRHSVEDPYHLYGGRLMRTFREQPWTRKVFTNTMLVMGAEPNVYLYYNSGATHTETSRAARVNG
ncbi:MAG: methyltransferase domain-containing protein [Candidatus Eisenbacteria bacterium]